MGRTTAKVPGTNDLFISCSTTNRSQGLCCNVVVARQSETNNTMETNRAQKPRYKTWVIYLALCPFSSAGCDCLTQSPPSQTHTKVSDGSLLRLSSRNAVSLRNYLSVTHYLRSILKVRTKKVENNNFFPELWQHWWIPSFSHTCLHIITHTCACTHVRTHTHTHTHTHRTICGPGHKTFVK